MEEDLVIIVLVLLCLVFVFELSAWLLPQQVLPKRLRNLAQRMRVEARYYYRADSDLRYTIRSGTDFLFTGNEFSFRMKTNLNFPTAGFRGATLGGPAWAVAVGDSFTFGSNLNHQFTWAAHLATLVKRDIINLGVPGYGPYQYTRVFEKYGAPFHPKVVFYGLCTNDLEDSVRFEKWLQVRSRQRFSLKRFLRQHSLTYNLFRKAQGHPKGTSKDGTVDEIGVKLLPRKLKDPYSVGNAYDKAWALTAQQIERALDFSKRIGATFILLYFPSKEKVYWDLVKDKVQSIESSDERMNKLRVTTLAFCESRQLPCLDLTAALKARALRRDRPYFTVDIHLNETGHRVVAQEIYRFLVEKNIL